jgi:hypothetical protein
MRLDALLFNPALVGVFALFFAAIWMLMDPRDKSRPVLVFALVLNLFYGFLLTVFMKTEGSFFPFKFDFVLFHLDTALGLRGEIMAHSLQIVRLPLWLVYQAMVPMMICWFLVIRSRGQGSSLIVAYAAELAAGPPVYAVLPACGPAYAFGAQWLHPQAAVAAAPIQLAGMPNAFPSLHAATALVLIFFAPGRWWRMVAIAFFAATCMATLSTGEHYTIDLIPGFAFGAFAAQAGLGRYRQAIAFLGAACCWSVAVRFGYPLLIGNPIVIRAGAAVTILAVGLALYRAWSTQPLPAATPAAASVLVP